MAPIPTVWGVPIVVSNSMTEGRFLMADFVQAARIRDRREAAVEFTSCCAMDDLNPTPFPKEDEAGHWVERVRLT